MNLSEEQEYAFDKFKKGENIVITGPGGTGKSKLIQNFVNYGLSIKKNIQVTALTGCAALLLGVNAKTIHSWSGIRLAKGKKEEIINQAMKSKKVKKNWISTKTLIIDEASMMSVKIFDLLNDLGRAIRNSPKAFGGIQIVLTCDFYQLPPVESYNEPDTKKFCFESKDWFNIFPVENHIVLKKIFRQCDDEYIEILNEIRVGELSEKNINVLKKYLNREYKKDENDGTALTKLFPTRSKVDSVNNAMFKEIGDESIKYELKKHTDNLLYTDSGKAIEQDKLEMCNGLSSYDIENEFKQLENNCQAISELELKKGATVMCNANIDMDNGICNGSQGIIIDLVGEKRLPKVKFRNGTIMIVTRHHWQSEQYPVLSISQFPLQLAWALTIHKIQGTTLKMAQMDIGKDIFEYGQTYVALSRIESLDGLYLSNFMPDRIRANPKVKEFYLKIDHPIIFPEKKTVLNFEEFEYKEDNKDSNTKIIDLKNISLK